MPKARIDRTRPRHGDFVLFHGSNEGLEIEEVWVHDLMYRNGPEAPRQVGVCRLTDLSVGSLQADGRMVFFVNNKR